MFPRLAINQLTTYSWSFEQDVSEYARIGASGIGIWRAKLTDYGVEKGADLIREHDLRVSSLHWAGGFTGSDGRSYGDSLRDASEALQVASQIDAPCVVVHSGARGGHTRNHARRLFLNALERLLPVAEEHNVALAIEPMHPGCAAEWTLLETLEQAAKLLGKLPSPHLQLVYDLYHFPTPNALLPQLLPRLAVVQLGDAQRPPAGEQNRCPLGDGRLPLTELVGQLEQMGYTGFYEVELRGEDVEELSYEELLHRSVDTFGDLICN